jgi:hypothetical protein
MDKLAAAKRAYNLGGGDFIRRQGKDIVGKNDNNG